MKPEDYQKLIDEKRAKKDYIDKRKKNLIATDEQNKWLQKKFSSGKLIDTLELAAEFSKKYNIELHLSETIVGQWVKLKTGKAGI